MRANRLRNLLLVYLTQLSGRLDWPNPCDGNILANLKLPGRDGCDGGGPDNGGIDDQDANGLSSSTIEDIIQQGWIEVTNLMRSGNELLFATRDQTRDLIRSGRYTSLLEHFQPRLRSCREDLDRFDSKFLIQSRIIPNSY